MPNPRMANNQLQALKKDRSAYVQSVISTGKTTREGLNNWYSWAVDKTRPSKREIQR